MMKKDFTLINPEPELPEAPFIPIVEFSRQDQLEAIQMGCLDGSSSEDNTEAALFDMIHGSPETMGVLGLFYEAAMASEGN